MCLLRMGENSCLFKKNPLASVPDLMLEGKRGKVNIGCLRINKNLWHVDLHIKIYVPIIRLQFVIYR